jgi:hypothetical protein
MPPNKASNISNILKIASVYRQRISTYTTPENAGKQKVSFYGTGTTGTTGKLRRFTGFVPNKPKTENQQQSWNVAGRISQDRNFKTIGDCATYWFYFAKYSSDGLARAYAKHKIKL